LRFCRKRQDGLRQNFFQGLREKNLFITIYIEKQCTRLGQNGALKYLCQQCMGIVEHVLPPAGSKK